jgi:hypothetical protein
MPDPCDYCATPDCDLDAHADDCRNANAYQYLESPERFISQHTTTELHQLRTAIDNIERAFTLIHRNAEAEHLTELWGAIGSIWDNARDLAYDELFADDIQPYD